MGKTETEHRAALARFYESIESSILELGGIYGRTGDAEAPAGALDLAAFHVMAMAGRVGASVSSRPIDVAYTEAKIAALRTELLRLERLLRA